jgi:hypothetical protein
MPTVTRIYGQNYTQLPQLISDDILLKGLPQTENAPEGYGDVADAILGLIEQSAKGIKSLPVVDFIVPNAVYNVVGFYVGSVVGGGQFIYDPTKSKATHNGGTVIAPEAILAWDGTQASLATLLNWTGSGSGCWVRLHGDSLSFEMFGAASGGVTNDTASVNKALSVSSSMQYKISGSGSYYAVSGNITLPAWVHLLNVKFKQLTPASTSRRTLFQSGGTFCRMDNVTIDRNGDGSSGSLSDAAGIWITNCPRVKLVNVEVFGNDAGSGIAVIACDDAEIESPYVHDMTAGTASSAAVTDDTLHGLWVQRGTGVRIVNPRVANLLNRWSGQAAFNRFSRGVAIGGAKRFSISSPMIDNVDQGVDITGDENPEFFEVTGGVVSNCYTWGVKCANSVQNGVITGLIAYRCGNAGFVASAPSNIMADRTQNITYNGCKSIQTGFGGAWTSVSNVAGFRVSNTVQYPDFPRSIKFIGCSADGTGGVMEYGFFNDSTLGTANGEQWIEAIHCDVQGATVKSYFGIQTGFANRRRSSSQSIANSTWVDLDYDSSVDYMGATLGAASTTLNATRPGIYLVTAGIIWAGSSAGTRAVRVLVDGAEYLGSRVRLPAVTSNEFNMLTSAPIPIANAGASIKVQVLQESGASLSITGGLFSVTLVSAGFGG